MATTTYHTFIALRLLNLTAIGAQIYLVWWLQDAFGAERLLRRIVGVATIVAAVAVYIYVAQRVGLPEPPRSRLGTSGEAQAVQFTYAFHRALGTFREPAEMASWLVVPFFVSFLATGRWAQRQTLLIASAILLSGSLAAIVGIVLGAIIAMAAVMPFRQVKFSHAAQGSIALVGAGLLFSTVASANDGGSTNLLQVMLDRLQPILNDGIAESNRDYLFDYYAASPFPLIGAGFGNANLVLSEFMRSDLPVSFLSFYMFTVYSSGVIGVALVVIFLLRPLLVLLRLKAYRARRYEMFFLMSAYVAWLIMFSGRSEEPPLMFAIAYSLLAYVGSARRDSQVEGIGQTQ